MKKKSILYVMTAAVVLFNACKEDKDETFKAPVVTAPANQTVTFSQEVELSFSYVVEAGFKTATVNATNGTAEISTNGVANAKNGTIVLIFTAGTTVGAGSVELTVTDNQNQTGQATAVISVLEEQMIFEVEGNITANATWQSGKVYILKNRVTVVSGVTLTIQPGVVVKGEAGTGANATALLIARGGKIMAEGTAEQPIIFTSIADEIMPGQIASPNMEIGVNGLWGGLIVLGNAPISASASSAQIEGIPASDTNGLYGGDNATDDSGVLKYISIRHGGANIGDGNEINGLTLGGVGSGTIIENVEVIANQDDGIEWFGGTVSVKNALIWNAGDDAVDTDQAWAGTLDNFVVICGADTDHALEIDGPEGTLMAGHTVKNGSVKGIATAELGDFRSGARGSFQDIYFFGFTNPANNGGRGDFSLSGDATLANFASGVLAFSGLQITLDAETDLNAVFKHGTDAHASAVAMGANTVGATIPSFGWTWASAAGELANF